MKKILLSITLILLIVSLEASRVCLMLVRFITGRNRVITASITPTTIMGNPAIHLILQEGTPVKQNLLRKGTPARRRLKNVLQKGTPVKQNWLWKGTPVKPNLLQKGTPATRREKALLGRQKQNLLQKDTLTRRRLKDLPITQNLNNLQRIPTDIQSYQFIPDTTKSMLNQTAGQHIIGFAIEGITTGKNIHRIITAIKIDLSTNIIYSYFPKS